MIINFINTKGVLENSFKKDSFRYLELAYTSGDTGSIIVHFAAEGDIVDMDRMVLVVNKDFLHIVSNSIKKLISSPGDSVVETGLKRGVFRQITSMTYSAG
tara:strand:- start:214 stop:516 length:303 start_codon:yes stop_codon:yes gene_type:complete